MSLEADFSPEDPGENLAQQHLDFSLVITLSREFRFLTQNCEPLNGWVLFQVAGFVVICFAATGNKYSGDFTEHDFLLF